MLEMKTECEKCAAPTPPKGEARICSFECTFCPNCGGELLARLKRLLDS